MGLLDLAMRHLEILEYLAHTAALTCPATSVTSMHIKLRPRLPASILGLFPLYWFLLKYFWRTVTHLSVNPKEAK